MRILWTLLAVFAAQGVAAQEVRDCVVMDRSQIVLNPLDTDTRTYANGDVTLGVIHDGRRNSPDSLFIVVYAPDPANADQRTCNLVGTEAGRGYATVRLQSAVADFTAADGLTVKVPARIYQTEEGVVKGTLLAVNVNRASNEVSVTQELAIE